MQAKILNLLTLILILSGCQTKQRISELPTLKLPELPLVSQEAVNEMKQVCIPRKSCDHLNNWLNEMYIFKVQYSIYHDALNSTFN